MKLLLKTGLMTAVMALTLTAISAAQSRGKEVRESPNASVSQTIGETVIELTYGRPAIRNRSYYTPDAELAPAGSVWRTGANENTTIKFSTDVNVAGKKVKAGLYSLFTVPGEKEWTIIINSRQAWGLDYQQSGDVIRSTSNEVTHTSDFAEWFTIYFESLSAKKANLVLHWGNTKVAFPISVE